MRTYATKIFSDRTGGDASRTCPGNRRQRQVVRDLLLVLFLAIFQFLACGEQKQHLVVYTTHGRELLEEVVPAFEAANSGVRVEWFDMGSQNVLDRVRSEQANPQADLWWGAPAPIFMKAAAAHLLQPYRPSWAGAVDSIYRDPNDLWYGTFLTPEVIGFNSENLTPATAPQDWDDLLRPEWKDRIVIRNPLASGTMRAIYVSMILRFYNAENGPAKGFEWLKKLDANTASYAANPTLMYLKLSRGEGDVTLWNMPDMLLQKNRNNFPFGYVVPKSGTVVVTDCIALVAGAKHPELAKKFYEFVTTAPAMIRQAHEYYRIPARRDIPREKLPALMQKPLNVLPIDWNLFAEKGDEWMKYWDEQIRHSGK